MRFKSYLEMNEEYEDMIRKGKDEISIFKNPDRTEMRDASERHLTLRWILDMENRDLYVWDGYVILHNQVVKHLRLNLGTHLRGESHFDGMKLSRSIWVPYKIPSADIGKYGGSLSASIAWVKANKSWLRRYFNDADIEGAYMGGMR